MHQEGGYDELCGGELDLFDAKAGGHQHDGLDGHAHHEKRPEVAGEVQFAFQVFGHLAQFFEPLGEQVALGSFVVRIGGELAEGGLRPANPPDTHEHKGPFGEVRANPHDEGQANEKQGHRSDVAHDVATCAEFVMFFRRCDFWQVGVVESEASPKSEVGQKQRSHAPFQMGRVEEEHARATHRTDVAENFQERQFLPCVVGHATEQGTEEDDDQKARGQHVAVELGVEEFHAPKRHHIAHQRAVLFTNGGHGIVEDGEDGGGDDQRVHTVRPVVHGPRFLDLLAVHRRILGSHGRQDRPQVERSCTFDPDAQRWFLEWAV